MSDPTGYKQRRTLSGVVETLPREYYVDDSHHEKELEAFWYGRWLCVGDGREISEPGSYRVFDIGDQAIVVVRDGQGMLRAYHNTCRHRGSVLCRTSRGQFANKTIVCPYHAWTYALSGELIKTPRRLPDDDFAMENFPLYKVAVFEWAGYVFANLGAGAAGAVSDVLDPIAQTFSNWQLDKCSVGYRMELELACNWKVFWENFSECYHCPGAHPELCRVVPLFAKSWTRPSDDPHWVAPQGDDVNYGPKLAPGFKTWSLDGKTVLPHFLGLTPAERTASHTVGVSHPSFYLIAHLDYARIVYLRPLGCQKTLLSVDWLFNPQSTNVSEAELEKVTALGKIVMQQDAELCELNQRGLQSRAHDTGVLVGQEHFVKDFHDYIRAGLAELEQSG